MIPIEWKVPEDRATMVTAVISMARSLKLRVVAEGVETLEELVFLQAHECDEAQGYYFSCPVPAQQFAELLETGIAQAVRARLRDVRSEPGRTMVRDAQLATANR